MFGVPVEHRPQSTLIDQWVYFVRVCEARSQKYLEVSDELRQHGYLTEQLNQAASLYVDEETLKKRAFELLSDRDSEERARGAWMICGLASADESIMKRCKERLLSDESSKVRLTILYGVSTLREAKITLRREVIFLHLHSLINDPSSDVRETAARHLESFADTGKFMTMADLPQFLFALVKTKNRVARVVLGRVATRLSTDQSLGIKEEKITAPLLAGFIKRVRAGKNQAKGAMAEQWLVHTWLNWWRPLIPKYAKPYGPPVS